MYLKISQYSQENTCVGVTVLQSPGHQLYQKETPIQMFSRGYCEVLKNNSFHRTSLVAVSETNRKSPAADDDKLITNNNLRCQAL